jgi:hypothetical protein
MLQDARINHPCVAVGTDFTTSVHYTQHARHITTPLSTTLAEAFTFKASFNNVFDPLCGRNIDSPIAPTENANDTAMHT